MQHRNNCPLGSVSAYKLYGSELVKEKNKGIAETDSDLPCPDRKCSTWYDLYTWFGFNRKDLSTEQFVKCFTDIGHGGSGIYERLTILGEKTLEMLAKMYISEKFAIYLVPYSLRVNTPESLIRSIWTLKRVERVTSPVSLALFSRAHLSTVQSLPSAVAAVKYFKACFGYSVQCSPSLRALKTSAYKFELLAATETYDARNSIIYDWATVLIDNVYFTQKFKTRATNAECELIQDMQEYFGYPYDTIIPRIACIINNEYEESGYNQQAQTGRNLIHIAAVEYFASLSRQAMVENTTIERWMENEVGCFMSSKICAIFACTYMNLMPIIDNMYAKNAETQTLDVYEDLFFKLLAACYSVTREAESKKYITALVCRLRQIQIMIFAAETNIKINGTDADSLALLQGIDIYRWSTLTSLNKPVTMAWSSRPREKHLDGIIPELLALQVPCKTTVHSPSQPNSKEIKSKYYYNRKLPTQCIIEEVENEPNLEMLNPEEYKLDDFIGKKFKVRKRIENSRRLKNEVLGNEMDKVVKKLSERIGGNLYKPYGAKFMNLSLIHI